MDDEILKTVHSIFGKDVKIVDCEKMSSVRQEEVLFINGVPVQLDGLAGDEADAIKAALLIGQMPSVDLLNQLLLQAGLLKQPVQLDTSLSVKSSMVTTEEVSVSRGGCVLDERSTETKEDYTYNSNKKEFWQPHLRNVNETGCGGIPEMKEMNSVKDSPPKRPERKNREDASLNKSATISVFSQPTPTKNRNAEDTAERYTVGKMTREYDSDATKQLCSSDTASSIASTISNYSTYPTDSSMDITSTALASSSCSFMLNQAASASNILPQGVCKKSSLSYDSGHDGIFHSMSQRAANSLSSCCDLVSSSSCNEIVQGNNLEDAGAAKMKTTTTQKNVVPYTENYDVELKGSNAQRQMLPMPSNVNSGRKSGGSNGSATSIKKAINNADTSLSTVQSSTASTNVTFSGSETSASPSSSTKNHRDHSNIADTQHLQKQGQKSYQHIRPQTLLAQYQQQQQTVDEQHCLVYYDGQLVSGSLEALIEHMVPTCDYYPTSTYIFSFLLSARLFIRPHELLSKISTTWEQQQQHEIQNTDVVDDAKEVRKCFLNSTDATISPDKMCAGATITTAVSQKKQRHQQLSMQLSAHNCIRLLAEWIETFPYDFRDERLMQQVRILARKCVYIDNALGKQVSRILQLLVQRLTVLEKYEDFLQSLTTSEFNATDSKQERTFAGSTTVPTTHNPLGRSSTTAISTAIKSQPLLQSSLSAGNANTSLSTQAAEFHSHYSNVDALQHNHPQSDSSTNSVNLTLHHLSGHFANSNSASSFNEIPGIMDLCPSSAQLAHQLTTIELDRLSHIGPEEFVQAFAKEYQHTFASQAAGNTSTQDSADFTGNVAAVMCPSLNDIKKTRNLESYVQWFNRLSYLTASEIVKYSKKKLRVRIIEYWIETARECFNIGNFNSLMAIIAGLNLAPISRLKKTWSKVQSAKFSVLEHQMDPTSNFNSYRSTLKAAMWRSEGATDERERIIIPFFSLFVKDLYFLNEGCSNRLSNNHINFEKCSQLSKQVMEFNEWKKVNCPFEKHPIVIMFLQSSAVLNENTLSMASFECEPPENTQEKGRYKTLKSETKQQMQQQLQEQKHQQQH